MNKARVDDCQARNERALHRLAELGRELGSERIYEEGSALARRVEEGRFYVACIGQFKRGKSTLLNALLGDSILPAGVLPITTVPTVVRYADSRGARVRLRGNSWKDIPSEELTQYVTEEHNPENGKGVVAVEVFCPSALLAGGMCFVDTPGLGSIFGGNTAATQAFVPNIDAALVVVGADPPIAGEELKLVEEVGKQVRDLIVILNKADKTSESDRQIAKSFTRNVLEKRLNRRIGFIYEVSSQERLEGCGPLRDWPKLIDALEKLAGESGSNLVRGAGEKGLARLSDELLAITCEEKEALLRPLQESEDRIRNLGQTISQAERSLSDLGYLLMAEQHRLSDALLDRRKSFLAQAGPKANAELTDALKGLPRNYGPKFRRDAMRMAQDIAREIVLPWLQSEQEWAGAEYRVVESRFVNLGNSFLKNLSESGIPELARMPNALESARSFHVPSRFTFERLTHVARPASPLRYLADIFLGAIGLFSMFEQYAGEFLGYLVDMNSARVQSDVMDRVQESRGHLEVEIRKLLHEVRLIAQRALEHARLAREQGAVAVDSALARVEAIEGEARKLRSSLAAAEG